MFSSEIPDDKNYAEHLNPNSILEYKNCLIEKGVPESDSGERFQFVRMGYFYKDSKYAKTYNRIVTLKDSYKP